MLLPDVNVCLLAFRPDAAPNGPAVRDWLEDAVNGQEGLAVSDLVLSAVIRLATNPRVFTEPATPAEALAFAHAVRTGPACVPARPSSRHWPLFVELVRIHRLRGNDIPDAWYAALALDCGATLVTLDRGFARFERLRTVTPGPSARP